MESQGCIAMAKQNHKTVLTWLNWSTWKFGQCHWLDKRAKWRWETVSAVCVRVLRSWLEKGTVQTTGYWHSKENTQVQSYILTLSKPERVLHFLGHEKQQNYKNDKHGDIFFANIMLCTTEKSWLNLECQRNSHDWRISRTTCIVLTSKARDGIYKANYSDAKNWPYDHTCTVVVIKQRRRKNVKETTQETQKR